ncbi:MAG TPA: GNAT family N-acetyltransferase [Rubricoccaceae bacterium]
MSALHVREAISESDWAAVRLVREAVFVREQACPPEEEWDAYDAPEARGRTVHHLLGTVGGATAACARWRAVDGGPTAKLERFAVLVPFRGRGLGRDLVAATTAEARAAGHTRFALHAQVHLAGFYASFGFVPVGERFWEAGIEHVKMTLEAPAGP